MYGSQSTTSSPSTVSTMRNTPCVAGCCGPTFTVMSTVSRSLSAMATRSSGQIDI